MIFSLGDLHSFIGQDSSLVYQISPIFLCQPLARKTKNKPLTLQRVGALIIVWFAQVELDCFDNSQYSINLVLIVLANSARKWGLALQKPAGARTSFDGEWLCGCSKSGQSRIDHSGIVPICLNPR